MKGDRVQVVVDLGGSSQSFDIVATRAGRRVDISVARGVVEVSELTRGGTPVRTARFMATRVIALVEHPAADRVLAEEAREVRAGVSGDEDDVEAGQRDRRRRDEADGPDLGLVG